MRFPILLLTTLSALMLAASPPAKPGAPSTTAATTKASPKPPLAPLAQYHQIDQLIDEIDKQVPLVRRLRAEAKDTQPDYTAFYDARDQMKMLVVDSPGEDSCQTNSYYYQAGRLQAVEVYFGRFGGTPSGDACIFKGTIRFYFVDGMCTYCTTDGKPGKIKWGDLNPALALEPAARRALQDKHAHRPASEEDFQRQFRLVVEQAQKGALRDSDLHKLHAYLHEDMPVGFVAYEYMRQAQVAEAVIATGSVEWMNQLRAAGALEADQILRFAGTKPQTFFEGIGNDAELFPQVRDRIKTLWHDDVRQYLKTIEAYIAHARPGPARDAALRWAAELRQHQERKSDEIPIIISAESARNPWGSRL